MFNKSPLHAGPGAPRCALASYDGSKVKLVASGIFKASVRDTLNERSARPGRYCDPYALSQ